MRKRMSEAIIGRRKHPGRGGAGPSISCKNKKNKKKSPHVGTRLHVGRSSRSTRLQRPKVPKDRKDKTAAKLCPNPFSMLFSKSVHQHMHYFTKCEHFRFFVTNVADSGLVGPVLFWSNRFLVFHRPKTALRPATICVSSTRDAFI